MSAATPIRLVFHLLAFALLAATVHFDIGFVPGEFLPIKGSYLSKFVWLTMIDLYIQTAYHLWGILAAAGLFGCKASFHYIGRVFAQPLGVAVPLLFWGLLFIDPATLIADEQAKRMMEARWFNHGLHTLPGILAIVDILVWDHGEPKKRNALIGIFTFSIVYIIDIHYVHHISGFWAYPILGALPLPARAAFILVCVLIIYACYAACSTLHGAVHGSTAGQAQKSNSRKAKKAN